MALAPTASAAPKVPSFTYGELGIPGGQLTQARGLAVNEAGNGGVPAGTVYIAEFGNNRIHSFAPDDLGTPGDPTDDTYSFLRTWGWDVIADGEPNDNGTGFEICDTTAAEPNEPADCKAGESGGGAGQFEGIAGGIAVHEGSGVVSIYDRNNERVQQFAATGEFLRAWGKDVIEGGGTDFEICEPPSTCKTGEEGSLAGEFGTNTTAIIGIAADAAGNVYVSDPDNSRVQKFSSAGAFLAMGGWNVVASGTDNGAEIQKVRVDAASGDFTLSFGAGAPTTTAAIDHDSSAEEVREALEALGDVAAGDVAVSGPLGGPWTVRFRGALGNVNQPLLGSDGTGLAGDNPDLPGAGPTLAVTELVAGAAASAYEVCEAGTTDVCQAGSAGEGIGQFNGGSTGTATPNYIAAAPGGDVYVVGKRNGTIYHLHPSLDIVEGYAESTGTGTATNRNAIAVDPTTGHFFFGQVNPAAPKVNTSIFELDPLSGELVATHPAGGDQWVGLAIDGAAGIMHGARTTSASSVQAFEEGLPSLTIEAPDPNSGTRATLKGTVNPNGVEVVECYFRWGPTTAYGNTVPCDPDAATIGDGTSPIAVEADIAGLVPNGATYNYRLVAVGAKESRSANQSFATPNGVTTEAATAITSSGATLHGSVNPDTVALDDCVFEYGPTTAYGQSAPCDPDAVTIGNGTSPVAVQAEVDLHPGTVYHFRLKATYEDGIGPVSGADQSLQTLGPRILATWSEDVAVEEAFLKAEIDPEGEATTYRFEYGAQGPCSASPCASTPIPDGAVGSDSTVHALSRFLEGLQPATTYHYRVVAINAAATNDGPDRAFTTFARFQADTGCANQAVRLGVSRFLPDCRAYEMVSPIDKNGGDIETAEQEAGEGNPYSSAYRQASIHGGKITYSSATAFGDAIGGHSSNQYLSTRGEHGWLTHGISSRRESTLTDGLLSLRWQAYPFFGGFTPDLSSAWVRDDNTNPLTPDALQGYVSLYRRDNGANTYEALTNQGPFGPADSILGQDGSIGGHNGGPRVVGSSSDLRHQVFTASAALTLDASQAPSGTGTNTQLYDLVDGELHLVSVLPGGRPAPGNTFAGTASEARLIETRAQMLKNAVSRDGSRIAWTMPMKQNTGVFSRSGPGAIYVRENPGEEPSALAHGFADGTGNLSSGSPTIASVATTNGSFEVGQTIQGNGIPPGTTITAVVPGSLTLSASASANGTGITLESFSECTEPGKACTISVVGSAALAGNSAVTDPAQFWAASADGSRLVYSQGDHPNRTLRLFDVESRTTTTITGESLGVPAAAEDLSRIYFVSKEALAPGAVAGESNLYIYSQGNYVFIGVLSSDDVTARSQLFKNFNISMANLIGLGFSNAPRPILNQTRITPDGRNVAFMSNSATLSAAVGYDNIDVATGKPDFQVYRYDAQLDALSCVSCNPSGARPQAELLGGPYAPLERKFTDFPGLRAAGSIPTYEHDNYGSRVISDDGNRLFFHSDQALLPRDTNGVQDVYQWQALGTGSCDSGDADFYAQNDGCIYLISSGRDGSKSEFVDADPTGEEVYFSTDESLDPRDPGLRDIYVAKVGGGFPIPQSTAPCEGEACQSPPPPPSDPTPASAAFQGPGNPQLGRDCGPAARRAARLSRNARRLRRMAVRAESPARTRALRRRSNRVAAKAKRLSQNAKRCRRANRRAAR